MVLAPTQPTFLELITERHSAFRAIEDSGADLIGHEMGRIKEEALNVIETGMAEVAVDGVYQTSAEAIQRAKGIVEDIDELYARGLDQVDATLISLKESAFKTATQDFELASFSIPGAPDLNLGATFTQSFPEAAQAAVQHPVLGITQASKWKGVHAGTVESVQKTLVGAVLSGESVEETAAKLAEGLEISQSAAERIARTNLNAMYNDAHLAMYNANPDIFVGYEWSTVWDDRTSLTCMNLSGTFYPLGTIPPGPPAHWNCRSLLLGVFGDPDIQAIMDKDTQRVKEYKADGTVEEVMKSGRSDAAAWLRRQPKDVQQSVLGSALKTEAFRNQGVSMSQMVDPLYQPYTDKQLIRRMAALRPSSSFWKTEAAARGIRVPSKKTILAEDAKLTREYNAQYQQPSDRPPEAPDLTTEEFTVEDLSERSQEAVAGWLDDYAEINDELRAARGDVTGDLGRRVRDMDKAIAESPQLREGQILYRGMEFEDLASVPGQLQRGGGVMGDYGFQSVSTSREVAEGFTTSLGGFDEHQYLFKMRVRRAHDNLRAAPVPSGLDELVLPRLQQNRGVKMKVLSVSDPTPEGYRIVEVDLFYD